MNDKLITEESKLSRSDLYLFLIYFTILMLATYISNYVYYRFICKRPNSSQDQRR